MWISTKELAALLDRMDALEDACKKYNVYDTSNPYVWGPIKPIAKISIWEMIDAIRSHLGLVVVAKPAGWALKKPDAPILFPPSITGNLATPGKRKKGR